MTDIASLVISLICDPFDDDRLNALSFFNSIIFDNDVGCFVGRDNNDGEEGVVDDITLPFLISVRNVDRALPIFLAVIELQISYCMNSSCYIAIFIDMYVEGRGGQ